MKEEEEFIFEDVYDIATDFELEHFFDGETDRSVYDYYYKDWITECRKRKINKINNDLC